MSFTTPLAQLFRGFAMGAADIVPGVSGGTVALVLGIYERLLTNIHTGASALKSLLRGDFVGVRRHLANVQWVWLISLAVGILAAIAVLSSVLEGLLERQPVRMAGLFFGLVAASLIVAWRMIDKSGVTHIIVALVVAVALFVVLGLRADTEVAAGASEVVTRPWWVFLLAGSIAICAMILPGISGSFLLVMMGMYTEVLGAVNERNLLALLSLAVGCVVGLALFSSVLTWALEQHHDVVIAAMCGLMLGSLRVLWPWPGGTATTTLSAPSGDVLWPVALAVVGAVVVLGADRLSRSLAPTD